MTLEQALNGAAFCARESRQAILVFFDVETQGYDYGAAKAVPQVWTRFSKTDGIVVILPTGEMIEA